MTDECRSTYPAGANTSQLINLGQPTGATSLEQLPFPEAELRRALATVDPTRICGAAAAVLEHIADGLHWTRGMSIVRRRGDGSLADRWPSVANALRKTDVDDAAERVTHSPVFRNLVAPPGRDCGRPVSTAEATRFGKAVVALADRTRCAACGEWWTASPPRASRWTCGCRSLVIVTRRSTR
jgi:hypothetical protein